MKTFCILSSLALKKIITNAKNFAMIAVDSFAKASGKVVEDRNGHRVV